MDKVLVAGIETVVGGNLAAGLAQHSPVTGVGLNESIPITGVNLESRVPSTPEAVRQLIEKVRPDRVVLCGNAARSGWDGNSSLTEFKRRNGFSRVDFPRYYVPLTTVGGLALALGIHRGWQNLLPPSVWTSMHGIRGRAMHFMGNPTSRGGG